MANNKEVQKEVQTKAPRKKSRLGNFLSKSFSELKKVSWPNFATVMQNLGIVLAVVVAFTAIIILADLGLSALLELLV